MSLSFEDLEGIVKSYVDDAAKNPVSTYGTAYITGIWSNITITGSSILGGNNRVCFT